MNDIYLDYAATTPVHLAVANKMWEHMTITGDFANAASPHALGKRARIAIEEARAQVAASIHADPSEIIWTSGATEANNLALKGIASLYKRKGNHIITMQTEHKSVLDTCMHLEKEGFRITYLPPLPTGLLSLDALTEAITDETILVSIMAVNNETGIIQDLASIRAITAERGVLLHTDAVQAMGKITVDVNDIPVDAMSLSAHKVYGPKGIGALYLRKRPRIRVAPLIHGGGHEQGMRSGTLATHQIVGMGEAFAIAQKDFAKNLKIINTLREQFLQHVLSIPGVTLNTLSTESVPHIANIQFQGYLADALLSDLPTLIASTSAACQEKSGSESHVLRAMQLSSHAIKASVRFSFGLYLNDDIIKEAANRIAGLFIKQ